MIIGVILAAGDGKRFATHGINKTTVLFDGKSLILYGVELFHKIVDSIYIVVGAYKESVIQVLSSFHKISFVEQKERLGTGHALIIALNQIQKDGLHPRTIVVGYGDHMMFFRRQELKKMIAYHERTRSAVSLVSTVFDDPDYLAWGRIVRNKDGELIDIVEQKDATLEQRKIRELNAGFYCIDYDFATKNMDKVIKSEATGEYYINEFTLIALEHKMKVSVISLPFEQVGYGINNSEQFQDNLKLIAE